MVQRHYKGEVKSILADLPITRARNNYSTFVNGHLQIDDGKHWKPAKSHQFWFQYFPISTEQVQTINGIFFDNAYITSRIVFKTKDVFTRSLESYLAAPCETGKIIGGDDAELQLKFLKRLTAVSKSLGSNKETVWREWAAPEVTNFDQSRAQLIERRRFLTKAITGKLDYELEFAPPYRCLGTTPLMVY
jgi:hypothetical protein